MVCPKCGSSISENASVCPSCGAKLGGVKTAAPAHSPVSSKQKRAIGIGCAVFFVFMICFVVLFGGKNKSALPLETAWGDSYAAIAAKDAAVSEATPSGDGGAYVCTSEHDGSLLNFTKDDVAITVSYDLGTDDALRSVTETVALAEGGSISGEKFVMLLTDRCNSLYGNPASSDASATVWNAEDSTFSLAALSDGTYAITLSPAA